LSDPKLSFLHPAEIDLRNRARIDDQEAVNT
jgi:hypothetical protein